MKLNLPLLIILLVLGYLLGQAFKAEGQPPKKTPAQVAAGCDASKGDVLARNIRDLTKVHLPAGKAMREYEFAYGDAETGQPNAICLRTRPFSKGEFAEMHELIFGNATHRFAIVEHDLERANRYKD